MKLAPSKNPEKESKSLSIIAFLCGMGSLLLWFLAIAGLALGVRAAILSRRVKNTRRFVVSLAAILISIVGMGYYLLIGSTQG